MMIIDGSQGEGGGQMIRSALGLALVTGKPFRIENIRAKRRQPGLRKQHLTAVLAAKRVGNARVEGAELGSSELTFQPKKIVAGQHSFRVGTAGSASLVLQTVLPALMLADAPSSLVLEGGTHNAWAPPFDYLREVYVPLVERMGPTIEMKLIRHGFYPVGGGKFTVEVTPAKKLQGYDILERGEQQYRSVRAIVSRLPLAIADRECDEIAQRLGWARETVARRLCFSTPTALEGVGQLARFAEVTHQGSWWSSARASNTPHLPLWTARLSSTPRANGRC